MSKTIKEEVYEIAEAFRELMDYDNTVEIIGEIIKHREQDLPPNITPLNRILLLCRGVYIHGFSDGVMMCRTADENGTSIVEELRGKT